MAYEYFGASPLNYYPCRYGESKLRFRGPKRDLEGKYCVVIGGTETFGKFVEQPYPDILAVLCDQTVVNLGCMHAGVELFANDATVLKICANSEITIIQLMGAQNMSNRFYKVHPRRNDRFLGATDLLQSIFQDLDFSDVHYTGHLHLMLRQASASRFERIKKDLQSEWVAQMLTLLGKIGGKILLLWLSDHTPNETNIDESEFAEPMFLNQQMISQLLGRDTELVQVTATPDEISAGYARMIFNQLEESAAHQMLGPIAHQAAARQLQPYLTGP